MIIVASFGCLIALGIAVSISTSPPRHSNIRFAGEIKMNLRDVLGDEVVFVSQCSASGVLRSNVSKTCERRLLLYPQEAASLSVLDISCSSNRYVRLAVSKYDLIRETMLPIHRLDIDLLDDSECGIPIRPLGYIGEKDFVACRMIEDVDAKRRIIVCHTRGNGNIQASVDAEQIVRDFPEIPDVESSFDTFLVRNNDGNLDIMKGLVKNVVTPEK